MTKVMATPAARRAAREKGVDISRVKGTGAGGYVQLNDVLSVKAVKATFLAGAVAGYLGVDIREVSAEAAVQSGAARTIRKDDVIAYHSRVNRDRKLPLSAMRKQIASRMSESMRTAPQYTMMMEVDCFDLKAYLKEFAERRQPDIGAAPTFSDLFIMACTIALLKNPLINSSFMGDHILVKGSINIGLAVSLGEDGLVVPNIKNAQSLTLDEIVRQRSDLVERARAGRLLPEEYSGGTFTISNLGVSPVRFFTPIINPPESAILGVGSIADKVAPIEGGLSVRPVGALSLTADHRNIDGAAAEKFMKDLKDILEHPEVMKEREA